MKNKFKSVESEVGSYIKKNLELYSKEWHCQRRNPLANYYYYNNNRNHNKVKSILIPVRLVLGIVDKLGERIDDKL